VRTLRLFVTGAHGLLGRAVAALAGEAPRADTMVAIESHGHADADVTDVAALQRKAGAHRIDVVVHLAAMTRVDDCEGDPDRAHLVNCLGARNAALFAAERGAAVLYVSTDYVFDGQAAAPYREYDPPAPLSVYGASKRAGEEAVREVNPRHYIVRSSWLFGPGGTNFVDTIRKKAEAGERLEVVDDQRGAPTYTRDLAPALLRMAASNLYGTYHVTNRGACTWFELAQRIVRSVAPKAKLERITSAGLARPAKRPANSVLSNLLYERSFGPDAALPPWEDAVDRHLKATS